MRIAEQCGPDGVPIVYVPDATVATDDPWIVGRLVREDGQPGNVSTHYRARDARAPGYPASLPFLAGREVHVTEHLDARVPPGARWICADPDAVIAALVAATERDGWIATPPRGAMAKVPLVKAHYERDGVSRFVLQVSSHGTHVVQLLDAPSDAA